MTRQDILDRLRDNEGALRGRCVVHAALFGWRVLGDTDPAATPTNIAPEAEAVMSVYDYVGLKRCIASLLDGPVDVIDRKALKPFVRPPAEGDAVCAFSAFEPAGLTFSHPRQYRPRPQLR